MSDYISREAALKIVNSVIIRFDELKPKYELVIIKSAMEKMADEIVKALVNLPSIDPEKKTGKWISEQPWHLPKCSICGAPCFGLHGFDAIKTQYCPTCGAKMEE